jgi:hypothetical protein
LRKPSSRIYAPSALSRSLCCMKLIGCVLRAPLGSLRCGRVGAAVEVNCST